MRICLFEQRPETLEPLSLTRPVFDLVSGKLKTQFGGHWNPIGSLAFSPDGKKLASIAHVGGVIKIWSLDDTKSPAAH